MLTPPHPQPKKLHPKYDGQKKKKSSIRNTMVKEEKGSIRDTMVKRRKKAPSET